MKLFEHDQIVNRKYVFMIKKINNSNLPDKTKNKLRKDTEKVYRSVFLPLIHHWMYCPVCLNNGDLELRKKVNQRKFKFRCKKCNFSFQIILKEGELLCSECNGAGYIIKDYLYINGKKSTVKVPCNNCGKKGKYDWCERITKAKRIS